MAKLIYKQPRKRRVKYGFISVTTSGIGFWFSCKDGKLKSHQEFVDNKESFSSHSRKSVKTIRAFRRFIKKHIHELPKGQSFILVSRWVGYDVTYTKGE